MNYINEIIIAIISTFICGFIKFIFDRRKELKDEKKEKLIKSEEQRKNRPEFVITSMKDSFNRPGTCIDSPLCDIEIFVAKIEKVNAKKDDVFVEYDDSILDKKAWVCRQYTIKNIGKTAVYEVGIITNNKRGTCLFNARSMYERVIKCGLINYYELLDKRVAPGESFTLKLCYNKDRIISGFFSAIFEIGMRDDNGIYWVQPFFAPDDKLYESRKITNKEYREMILTDKAIECFKKPYLW